MGDKVAVTLHWFPPSHSDLPVSRYKATLPSLILSIKLTDSSLLTHAIKRLNIIGIDIGL